MPQIHPLAEVQAKNIGAGTRIWQFVVIFKEAIIGENCNICSHCLIENKVVMGNNVTLKSGVQLWDGIIIEDNVFIGPNVTFTNDPIPRSKGTHDNFKQIILKKGCSIGANSTLVAGVTLGQYAFVGAGSVVTKSIGPHELWYGNPARKRGYITKEGLLLGLDLCDPKTGQQYTFHNNELIIQS